MKNRLTFVKENRLCFGCLRRGHEFKDCQRRLSCSACYKKHPTCLHKDSNSLEKKEDGNEVESPSVHNSTSCTSQGVSSKNTSMIVPVWLSVSSKPNKELLVYAILDTQSDATFILKETCDELGTETEPTKLRLSPITTQELLVDSQRISNLQVRGYNSDLKITIPTAFTRTMIPADDSCIPTKSIAKGWDHLQLITDEMQDLLDCTVGLLIGYDCSQALTPREVITGKSNEPYGVRTDLGWSIVGSSSANSGRSFC